jgi:hypothetical protein
VTKNSNVKRNGEWANGCLSVLRFTFYVLLSAAAGDQVVQAVDRAEEGALAAAAGADEGDDRVLRNVDGDLLDRLELAVEDADALGVDQVGVGGGRALVRLITAAPVIVRRSL